MSGRKRRERLGCGLGRRQHTPLLKRVISFVVMGDGGPRVFPGQAASGSVAHSGIAGLSHTPLDSKLPGTAKSCFICLNWMGFLQGSPTCADVVNGAFLGHKQYIYSAPRLVLKQRRMQREKREAHFQSKPPGSRPGVRSISAIPSGELGPEPGEGPRKKRSGDSETHGVSGCRWRTRESDGGPFGITLS